MKRSRAATSPYGAVVVEDRRIVGHAPSRVVSKNDASAHAEREAIRDAQARLRSIELSDCVLYSSSRPCAACERAAAEPNCAHDLRRACHRRRPAAMIDHVSVGVRDLERAARFYEQVLGTIGYRKLMHRPRTVGFGKSYPEFWINLRAAM